MHHQETLIATAPTGNRHVFHAIPSADNRVCLFLAGSHANEGPSAAGQQIFLNDMRCVEPTYALDIDGWCLSPDGTKLATSHRVTTGGDHYHTICINGKCVYRSSMDTVSHLCWLGNERLAWLEGMKNDSERRTIVTRVNGEDVTDRLAYERVYSERNEPSILLLENDRRIVIDEDGKRQDYGPAETLSVLKEFSFHHNAHAQKKRAQEVWSEDGRRVRLRYRDFVGPLFDGIGSEIATALTSYTEDRNSVGYVGMRYGAFVRWLGNRVSKRHMSSSFETMSWLTAIVFNPHFGPGFIAIQRSRRFYPTVNDRSWKKNYKGIANHFFTPSGVFVVVATEDDGQRVALDEEEGPLFDEILHARWLASENCVCYVGRRGSQYFRVTVTR